MLMNHARDCLIVIDVQERLTPVMDDPRSVIHNCQRLMKGAALVNVPLLVTEQYPRGLGATMADLRPHFSAENVVEKMTFSASGETAFLTRLHQTGRRSVVLAGIEAHVCVLQTALELQRLGWSVKVVRDASNSRQPANAEAAYQRMISNGLDVVTTEMVLFEWLGSARHPAFKAMQGLIK